LGADERIFKNLVIPDVTLKHLSWQPFDKGETMASYAMKMFHLIEEKQPTILGLSFGGMLATEIAKQATVHQTFLVSSVKCKQEFPDMSSFIAFILKTGIVPFSLFTKPNKFLFERFGAITDEEKKLLTAILKDTAPNYLRNAFKMILNWENTIIPPNIKHIHGTHDNILISGYVHPDKWVREGTHMMVWNKANEIANWIKDNLQ
jgi:hypothetical protein